MHWNYRIVKRTYEHENGEKEDIYGIHEAFYEESGKPISITIDPIEITGESIEDLEQTLKWIKKAFKKDVLNYEDF